MMTDDPDIAVRLQMPIARCEPRTAIDLVRNYYEIIRSARNLCPRERKTWDQIGFDLRPSDPFQGGTVGRAFARVTAERFGPGLRRAKATRSASQIAPVAPKTAAAAMPATQPTLFSRVVDPIGLSTGKDA